MLNALRSTPRLFLVVLLLLVCSLLTRRTWQTVSHQTPTLPSPTTPLDTKRWDNFLNHLHELRPASDSIYVPDGHVIIRVEELNETTPRLDHAQISEEDFYKSRESHKRVLGALPAFTDLVQFKRGSRGIVTVAGGLYSQALIVSIRMLRRTKCNLPVEVFIPAENPEGKNEFDPYTCHVVLKALNAHCVPLPKLANFIMGRYAYKSVALLFSAFEEALFFDADIFPLVDPSKYFTIEPYSSTGLLTWPDFWAPTCSPVFYAMVEQPPPSLHTHASTEAGAMVISRKKHAATLLLAFYYNIYGPGFFYELLSQGGIGGEGDKETWIAAARVLKAPYYQVRERNHALVWGDDETILDEITAMVQMDPIEDFYLSSLEGDHVSSWRNREESKPALVHANRVKMNPSTVLNRLEEFHGQRRIWGPKEKTVRIFGWDLEADLWMETIHVACYNGKVLLTTQNSRQVCEALRRFWWRILMEEDLEVKLKEQNKEDEVKMRKDDR